MAALGLAVEAGSKYPSEARGLASTEGAAAVGAAALPLTDAAAVATYLIDRMSYLRTSRPTAVRIFSISCMDESLEVPDPLLLPSTNSFKSKLAIVMVANSPRNCDVNTVLSECSNHSCEVVGISSLFFVL